MEPIMFGATIIAFVLAVALLALLTRGRNSTGHLRVVGTVFLLAVTAFCIFGFLASFELAGVTPFHLIYSGVGVASLIGAGCVATQPAPASSR
jgi:asparagine N-glycosylation enzyme membrane subunit Stt3